MPQRRIISLPPRLSQERWGEMPPAEEKKRHVSKRAGKAPLVLLLSSVVVFVFAIYIYWSISQKAGKIGENLKQSGQSVSNSQILIDKVSHLILLPKNERPSIAIINNVAVLQKDSSFYKDARNGDVLLIYFQAKKAYIYNPTENVIVNVGPLILSRSERDPAVAGENSLSDTPAVVSTSTANSTSTSN